MHVLGQHLKKNRQKINRCAPATTHTWNAGSGLLKSRGETKQNKRSAVKKKSKMRFVNTQTYLHRTWKCHSELKNCFFVTALSQFGAEGRCGYIPTPRVSVTPKLSGGDWGVWGAVSLLVPACNLLNRLMMMMLPSRHTYDLCIIICSFSIWGIYHMLMWLIFDFATWRYFDEEQLKEHMTGEAAREAEAKRVEAERRDLESWKRFQQRKAEIAKSRARFVPTYLPQEDFFAFLLSLSF